MNFQGRYHFYKNLFEDFLREYIRGQEESFAHYFSDQLQRNSFLKDKLKLKCQYTESYARKIQYFFGTLKYSLNGEGKRFRPVLVLATAEMLGNDPQNVLPFALAIELIHTYSLIHDDLPCMDNDDFRRGKPTNHRVYGEATALLAGDALLTEAFSLAMQSKAAPQDLRDSLLLLVEYSGIKGMIGGQYFDLESQKRKVSVEELIQMQVNKTGALMNAAAIGAAILSHANAEQMQHINGFSNLLGLSFQIADDILDLDKKEMGSIASSLGVEASQKMLEEMFSEIQKNLSVFPKNDFLIELAKYNIYREK